MILKWKYLPKGRKTKMIVGIAMCFLTIASLSVSTIAWFSTLQGRVSVTFGEMVVSSNQLKFQVKYYSGNWNDTTKTFSGYRDPRVPGAGGTVVQHGLMIQQANLRRGLIAHYPLIILFLNIL